jgi:hypothetical protein
MSETHFPRSTLDSGSVGQWEHKVLASRIIVPSMRPTSSQSAINSVHHTEILSLTGRFSAANQMPSCKPQAPDHCLPDSPSPATYLGFRKQSGALYGRARSRQKAANGIPLRVLNEVTVLQKVAGNHVLKAGVSKLDCTLIYSLPFSGQP